MAGGLVYSEFTLRVLVCDYLSWPAVNYSGVYRSTSLTAFTAFRRYLGRTRSLFTSAITSYTIRVLLCMHPCMQITPHFYMHHTHAPTLGTAARVENAQSVLSPLPRSLLACRLAGCWLAQGREMNGRSQREKVKFKPVPVAVKRKA